MAKGKSKTGSGKRKKPAAQGGQGEKAGGAQACRQEEGGRSQARAAPGAAPVGEEPSFGHAHAVGAAGAAQGAVALGQHLRARPRQDARQLRPADAAAVHRAQRDRLSRQHRADPWRAAAELGRDLCALPKARLGAGQGRHRRRRHGGDHGAQHPRDVRGAFRRADDRRRAELAEHAARCGDDRLHPRPQRDQGAAGRSRVPQGR